MSCQNNCPSCKCRGITPSKPLTIQEENNQLAEELAGYCRISVFKDGQLNDYLLLSKDREYSTVDRRYNDSNNAFIEYTATYFPHGILTGCSETKGGVKTYASMVMYHYCADGNYIEQRLFTTTR